MIVLPSGTTGLFFLNIVGTNVSISGKSLFMDLSSLFTSFPSFLAFTETNLTLPSAKDSICSAPG